MICDIVGAGSPRPENLIGKPIIILEAGALLALIAFLNLLRYSHFTPRSGRNALRPYICTSPGWELL